MAQVLGTLLIDIKADTQKLIQGFDRAEKTVNKASKTMATGIKLAAGAFFLLQNADFATNIVKQMDMITEANNKLKLSTAGTTEFVNAQRELFKVSQRTNQGYSETVKLYADLSTSMGEMGKSQSEILRTVETVNKAIAISGATSQQASAAVLQLGQAFGSGGLKGDELTSLKENAQGLIRAIADGMGVAVGDLKKLGSQGKITSEVLAQALSKSAVDIDEKHSKMTVSVSQGYGNLTNSLSVMTGEFFNAIGAGNGLATTLLNISKTLDENKEDIIKYGITTVAVIDKIVDNFVLLGVDIKNTAELALDTIGIMAFGALKPIAQVLLEITKGLHDINLASNETLANAQGLFDFADKGFTNFTQSAINNVQDMDNAYLKANVSIEDRIKAMTNEAKAKDITTKEITTNTKKVAVAEVKTTGKVKDTLQDRINQYMNYYEKVGDYAKLWTETERELKKNNNLLNEQELNKLVEVEKAAFEKRYATEKEYLSADEWKNYFLTIKDYENAWLIEQGEIYAKYEDNLKDKFPQFLSIAKNEFFDKIKEEQSKLADDFFKFKLEFDTAGLNQLGKSLYTIRDATEEIQKEQKLYNEAISEARDTGKNTAKIEEQHTRNQLIGYSNIAGAMSTMFEEGSREAASFQAIQTTLALIEATRAVVSQGSGDPYTAIPRMIAMAAMVSSLLGNVGIAFGMNKTSTSSDAFSSMAINEGKGTVIGDSDRVSESITKSLDILEDFAEPQFQTLVSMNKYLANISNAMGGVTTLLVRNAGFALGEGFTPTETAWKNNITSGMQTAGGLALNAGMGALLPGLTVSSTVAGLTGLFGAGAGGALTSGVSGLLGAGASQALTGALVGTGVGLVTMLVDKFILGGVINNAIGSVLGGLFGKTKVTTKLHDSGLYFADTLLGMAIDSIEGSLYQTIKIKTEKKSWFSSSSSTKYKSYFEDMDNELERQFSLVLRNLYGVTVEAGDGLDMASNDLINKLNNFVVKFGKVSLKGKNADEIQKTLEAVFSQIGDNIAEYIFPALIPFQKVGEGLFQTMTRVASGMEEAEFYISRLGSSFSDINYLMIQNKQGNVGFEALLQSITAVEEKLYPTNNGLMEMVYNLDITAEELYQVYTTLEELRDRLIFLKQEAQGLSSAMIYGAGSVSDLQKGLNSFFENFLTDSENLAYETEQLIEQFNKLNIALPVSKQGFKDLLSSLDLTSKSGQELYGRLIILSESFANVADKTAESIAKLENELLDLKQSGLDDLTLSFDGLFNSIKGLKEIAKSFIDSFSTSSLGNTREQIKEYNKLRKEFNSFFDANGNLNANATEKEAKDLYTKLSGLGTAIGKSQEELQKDLVSQFEMDLSKLDLSDQILKVDIVNGLADLLGLTETQKAELQKIASDGNITKTELESIKGLTETQKNGILDFANKSGYFSTEDTLKNLALYSKLQLEAYQKSIAEETSKLSKSTFSYGDYIGKQEKIDIAKTLGVSYEAAEPLIQKLQALSVSKNVTADIQGLLGYKAGATSYNTTMASQLQALSPYLNYDINGIVGGVQSATAANLAEQRRQEAIARATAQYYADYNAWANTISSADAQLANFWATLSGGSRGKVFREYFTGVTDYQTALKIRNSITGSDNKTLNDSIKDEEFLRILKIKYDNQNPPVLANYLRGYAVGAVNIPNDQIAQIHQNEMIIPATFAEGLRNGDLTLSANTPNVNLGNINLFEGVKEIMQDIFKSINDYPKKTHDLLDDVINGRSTVRVEQI